MGLTANKDTLVLAVAGTFILLELRIPVSTSYTV